MDSYKLLVNAHSKARKLEKEIKKERCNLIKEFKNKDSSDSNWDITKIKYTAFAAKLKEVTATFDKLLDELDNIDMKDSVDMTSDCNSEIINNFEADSDSSTGSDDTLNLIKSSVPMTEELSVDETQIKIEIQQKEEKEESQRITVIAPKEEVKMEDKAREESVPTLPEKHKKVQKILNGNNNTNKEEEYPTLSTQVLNGNKNTKKDTEYKETQRNNNTPPPVKRTNMKSCQYKRGTTIGTVRAGYKYKGEGFRVFTGPLNRSRPIYSSTTLFCYETCNQNEQKLRKYLIEFGRFKNEMIEEIVFKKSYNIGDYALIKVRGKLSYIKNKIKTLNKAKRNRWGDQLSIFERSTIISHIDYLNRGNVLYVNNFDLLKDTDHKRFTKLFLQFGELIKDIRMGRDRSKDPYAIIHFREESDAVKAFEKTNLMFNGKKLQIQFSKF